MLRINLSALMMSVLLSTVAFGADLPNVNLTPGEVYSNLPLSSLCKPGYTATVRNVPSSLKSQVYREYGIKFHAPGSFEVDHLISLELGGDNSIKNLWPESYVTKPLNAYVKDALENRLHALVCSGKLDLTAAQKQISTDWIAAYKQYVGRLPQ